MSQCDGMPGRPETSVGIVALEALCAIARSDALAARRRFEAARKPLSELEQRASQARATRRAASESLRLSQLAACRSGLALSAVTRVSWARLAGEIDKATFAVREIVSHAAPICDAFDSAWEALVAARAVERASLEALFAAKNAAETETEAAEQGRREAERVLTAHDSAYLEERAEQQQSRAWMRDDPHYDPHYDEREIALRRMRPWV